MLNKKKCDSSLSFQECELAILRQAVDNIEINVKKDVVNNEDVKMMINIVENFLKDTECICYGGTAINNILPKQDRFYDKDLEIPDYDFYSKTPVEHAKKLTDIYYEKGYTDVEAKAGVHYGTYKVFVNFIPMADITLIQEDLFENLKNESIEIDGILYASPNFLRMGMFLELSRPNGDVTRWEKVLKRLTLLNKNYPVQSNSCHLIDFQRNMDSVSKTQADRLYYIVRDGFIKQKVIFFGGYAGSLYSQYMPHHERRVIKSIPDFDVICENAKLSATMIMNDLKDAGFKNIKVVEHEQIGEIIPLRYEIMLAKETLAFVYEPIACHSYNEIKISNNTIRVATIDTILSFYLAFLYADHTYLKFFKQRLLCISTFLYKVQERNRLSQQGLLKRFSIHCYGKQSTLETIRSEKSKMFKKLRNKRNSKEWEEWFLKYAPKDKQTKRQKTQVKNKKTVRKTVKKKKKNSFLF